LVKEAKSADDPNSFWQLYDIVTAVLFSIMSDSSVSIEEFTTNGSNSMYRDIIAAISTTNPESQPVIYLSELLHIGLSGLKVPVPEVSYTVRVYRESLTFWVAYQIHSTVRQNA
jgi:hypothetical protein